MNNRKTSKNFMPIIPMEETSQKPPINHGHLPSFKSLVTQLFIPVENVTRNRRLHLSLKKSDVISRFITNYRQTVGSNILPVARLYFPKWDRKRVYMMKEYKLGKIVCNYLKLSKDTEDYKRIHNWKRLSYNHMRTTVQFSDLLVEIISRRRISRIIPDTELLYIDDVNFILDQFNDLVKNNKTSKMSILQNVINRMEDGELRYFFRIILKSDPVGSESVFLNCWHPDARRLYDLTHDLKLVFWGLTDPSSRLQSNEKQIKLMLPFTPQRCQRVRSQYSKIASDNFNDLPFLIEEKFDGERIQVHIMRDSSNPEKLRFKYFTRNAIDYTSIYGPDSGYSDKVTGCISPLLGSSNFHENMNNCILDGEMICYDPVLRVPLPYSSVKLSALHTLAILGKKGKSKQDPHPMFMAFDCVYLNDTSLEDYDLTQRKSALNYILRRPIVNLFMAAGYMVARSGNEIEAAMKKAISTNSEGVVLKDMRSKYIVGSTSKEWIKVKPEYLEEFGENLDLILVGKIPGSKTSYICGLRDNSEQYNTKDENVNLLADTDCKFITLCKISNGFSLADYKYIDQRTKNKWKKTYNMPQHSKVRFGKMIPEFWIDPMDSVVIEVRARSITLQPQQTYYATSTTLYNAYCVKIRPDKDWKTASTLTDYEMSSNRAKMHSIQTVFNGKRKREIHRPSKKKYMLNSLNKGYMSLKPLAKKKATLFSEYIFSVKTDCIYHNTFTPISKLNMIITRYGGTLARDPESVILNAGNHLIIVAERMTTEVKSFADKYNIFKFKWCEDCITTDRILSPDYSHVFVSNPTLHRLCGSNEGKFGGNPIASFNKFTFWDIAKNFTSRKPRITGSTERFHFSNNELYHLQGFLIFSGMSFMLINDKTLAKRAFLIATLIHLNGGKVTEKIGSCSMVIFLFDREELISLQQRKDDTLLKIQHLMEERGKLNYERIPHIVNYNYIIACIKENCLVEAENYKVFLPS